MIAAPGATVAFRDLATNQRYGREAGIYDEVKTSPRRYLRVNGDAGRVETVRFTVTAGPMDSAAVASAAAKGRLRREL